MARPAASRRFLRDLGRAASWHRRKLAVLATVGAVLAGIGAVAPEGPPRVAVVLAASRLPGGSTVTSSAVDVARVPEGAVPEDAVTDPAAVLGKTLLGPVAEGAVLTTLDVVSPSATSPGRVVAPLRLADADVAALLHPGDRVDVLAAEPEAGAAAVVAREVRVLAVPEPTDQSGIGGGSTGDGALLLVEVRPEAAAKLAQATVTAKISIVLR